MTDADAERRRIEGLAHHHNVATGSPLFVPQTLFNQLVEAGIDTSNIRVPPRIPVFA